MDAVALVRTAWWLAMVTSASACIGTLEEHQTHDAGVPEASERDAQKPRPDLPRSLDLGVDGSGVDRTLKELPETASPDAQPSHDGAPHDGPSSHDAQGLDVRH